MKFQRDLPFVVLHELHLLMLLLLLLLLLLVLLLLLYLLLQSSFILRSLMLEPQLVGKLLLSDGRGLLTVALRVAIVLLLLPTLVLQSLLSNRRRRRNVGIVLGLDFRPTNFGILDLLLLQLPLRLGRGRGRRRRSSG